MNGTSRTVTKEIFKELSFTSLKTVLSEQKMGTFVQFRPAGASQPPPQAGDAPSVSLIDPLSWGQSMGERRTWGARKEWGF